jgi:A/G-specific adenine glycosylase
MNFGSELINWYQKNKRELPWRGTKDPYRIWLSEIILQQTRVDQGLAYYHRFLNKYPDLKKLANAKEDEVLKLWQGLGYYSRARNLHHTAKEVVMKHGGKFPNDYASVRSLKGIGDYTAAAILSFAFNKKFPVADGNVFRLLSRYYGIEAPIETSKAKKEFFRLAGELMENHPPAIFNQAIMEFGSRQCRPANPDCNSCPLHPGCYAFSKNKVKEFPVKKAKAKIKNRYFNYLVISENEKIILKKRSGKDIWKNLYDFPMIETSKKITEKNLFKSEEWKNIFGNSIITVKSVSTEHKHLLSHQNIHAKFYKIETGKSKNIFSDSTFIYVRKNKLNNFAVPKLIENYLKTDIGNVEE